MQRQANLKLILSWPLMSQNVQWRFCTRCNAFRNPRLFCNFQACRCNLVHVSKRMVAFATPQKHLRPRCYIWLWANHTNDDSCSCRSWLTMSFSPTMQVARHTETHFCVYLNTRRSMFSESTQPPPFHTIYYCSVLSVHIQHF